MKRTTNEIKLRDSFHFIHEFQVFGKGKDTVGRSAFMEFLISAYELSSTMTPRTTATSTSFETLDLDGREWIEAVTKSCVCL